MTTFLAGPVVSRHVPVNIKFAASIAVSIHVAFQAGCGLAVDHEIQLPALSRRIAMAPANIKKGLACHLLFT
jgi:hypothetical protein